MEKTKNFFKYEDSLKDIYKCFEVEATLEKALTEKITYEVINQKVSAQVNTINFGIRKINSKFTEKSKNYDIVKEEILDVVTKYENVLTELAEFYDEKIEQLILRKFELENHYVGRLSRKKYLNLYKKKQYLLKGEKIKSILTSGIKKAINLIKDRKENNDILKKDKEENDVEENIDIVDQKIKENDEKLDIINKEIFLTTTEIQKLNERKKKAILDAMETEDKWITTKIRKPRTFEKITRFFTSRINTPKVIKKNIIDPLNEKINSFINVELKNIK